MTTGARRARSDREAGDRSADPQRSVRNRWLDALARFGLASRALVYLLVGALAAWVGVGTSEGRPTGRTPVSGTGAIRAVAQAPGGRWLLVVLAGGLAGFAFFQVLDSVFHARKEETAAARWGHRLVAAWGVVLYVALCGYTLSLASSPHPGGGSARHSDRTQAELTARVMRHGVGGRLLVGAFGAVLLCCGLGLLRRALTANFRDRLDRDRMSHARWRLAVVLGAVGCFGRAAAIGTVGGFVVTAAVTYAPHDATGLDGTLRAIAAAPYGPPLLVTLGATLACYAGYVLVEARYRKV